LTGHSISTLRLSCGRSLLTDGEPSAPSGS